MTPDSVSPSPDPGRDSAAIQDMLPTAPNPGQDPAAIRDMLPTARVADFARFYNAALDEAKSTYSLEAVEETLEKWRQIAAASQQTRQDFQCAAPGAQRWSDDYQKSTHTRLERVHASAGVWLGVLTTIVTLLGSLVLLKGGSLVTEVTTNTVPKFVLWCLVCLVFLLAVLALLAGSVATFGGLWDFGEPDSDSERFRHITNAARRIALMKKDDRTYSSGGKAAWVTYRKLYRSNAERSRIYLHASRALGVAAAILIGLMAIAAITVGTFTAPPTYVLVVHDGGVTCMTSTQSTTYQSGVTQVTPVDSC